MSLCDTIGSLAPTHVLEGTDIIIFGSGSQRVRRNPERYFVLRLFPV